jgi:hypothetical protein
MSANLFLSRNTEGSYFFEKLEKKNYFFQAQAADAAALSFYVRFDDSNIAERSSPLQINPH